MTSMTAEKWKYIVLGVLLFSVLAIPAGAAEPPEIKIRLGHSEPLLAVAASPDGRELATCSDDAVNLWEIASGTVKRTLARRAAGDPLSLCGDLAFTPDGRYLLTSGLENSLWDLSSGQQVFSAVRDPSYWRQTAPNVVAMAKDGKTFLYLAGRTRIVLAEVMTNREIAAFDHGATVNAVALSPDGRYAASGGDDKVVRLWDISTGREIRSFGGLFSGHSKGVTSVAFTPDGAKIVSGSRDETVRVWDVGSGKELYKETEHHADYRDSLANEVSRVAVSPDGKLVAIVSDTGISVKNIASPAEAAGEEGNLSRAVCFSPDSRYFYYGKGSSPAAKEAGKETGREIKRASEYTLAISYAPDGRYVAVSDRSVRLYEVASGRLQWESYHGTPFPGYRRVDKIAFSGDASLVATGDSEGEVAIREVAGGKEVSKLKAGPKALNALAFSPDGSMAATASPDGTVKFWEAATGREVSSLKADDVLSLSFSSDGRQAVMVSRSGEIKVVEAASGKEISATLIRHGKITDAVLSPDNRKVLLYSDYGIAVFSLPDGKLVQQLKVDFILFQDLRLAFSSDGQQVLGYSNGKFTLWDAKSGAVITQREVGTTTAPYVPNVAWAPDGEHVMVNLPGGSLYELRLQGEKNPPVFVSHVKFPSVAFTADDRALVLGNKLFDGTASLLNGALGPADFVSPGGGYVIALDAQNQSRVLLKELATAGTLWRDRLATTTLHAEEVQIPWNESVVAVPDDKGFHVLDFKTGAVLREVEVHGIAPRLRQISPDGEYLLVEAGGSQLWNLKSGKLVRQEKLIAGQLVSWQGGTVLARVEGGAVILSHLESGREVARFAAPGGDFYNSADGGLAVVTLGPGRISVADAATGSPLKNFRGISGDRAAFSHDGRFLLSREPDGTAALWDIASGQQLVHFYAFSDGEWVAITPQGYFNASPNAARYLTVGYKGRSYAIDQFFETFFNPAAVASAVRGNPVAGPRSADIRRGFSPPPGVAFVSPAPNFEAREQQVEVVLKATDQGGGINEVRLFVNGKVLEGGGRGVRIVSRETPLSQRSFLVPLVEGENRIKAVAFSDERIEGEPVETVVRYLPREVRRPDLYLLTVGINSYQNGGLNLRYAVPDARDIGDYFENAPAVKKLFKHVTTLRRWNEQATRAGILSALEQLKQMARPEDLVVLFFSGHGETSGKSWYFIPYELTTPEDEGELKGKGISGQELAEAIRALKSQKILGVLDSCKSGAQLVAMRGLEERAALVQLGRSTGIYMLSASTDSQLASEVKELGHGLLTYTLLEGLKGSAGRRKVTVEGLMKYVKERLPELTMKYQGSAQYPVSWGRGMDFPLVLNGD